MASDFEFDDPQDPYGNGSGAPKPPANDPWTPQELAESQNWANTYYTSHQIPAGYGTPDDLGNSYLTQRRAGVGHQEAMNAVPGLLGWDKYQAPSKQGSDVAPDYGSDGGILAQIARWAAMPGADPSLGADPQYWLRRIKETGGLRADNLQWWQNAGVGPTAFFNNPNREAGNPPPSTSTTTSSGSSIPAPRTSSAPANQEQADELYRFLMQRAHQSQIIDPNDPLIRTQADNYSANMTRQGRRYLSELAERKGAGGNIGAESRMVSEKNAQASASHEGELIQHESDQRRQEIEQALALGAQFMTAQQQMALQRELAAIDDNMRLYQTQIQNEQFGRSLNQNQDQFGRTLAQGDRTMSQREREFNDNLRQRAYEYDTDDEYRRSPYAG